jgi:MoxR-like ATPase
MKNKETTLNSKHQKFLQDLAARFAKPSISRSELLSYCEEIGIPAPQWYTGDVQYRAGRGIYKIPVSWGNRQVVEAAPPVAEPVEMVAAVVPMRKYEMASVETAIANDSCVPAKYANYVPFGPFNELKKVISSRKFFPVFITGPSGNGKSMSVEQACAQMGREFVAISMTDETDEGDLLGNYVLIDGNMVWRDGAVTVAARKGAVLLIDEIDYGSKNLSCLQRVLEGKPFLLKKKNEVVVPAPGFTVIATANTKGQGSDSGRYMFTNILNEAFLERFPITIEQPWAPKKVETSILVGEMRSFGIDDVAFAGELVEWADIIRRTFEEGGVEEVISTRRLVHIVKAFSILGDKQGAINACLARFDAETKASFLDLFEKVTAPPEPAVVDEIDRAAAESYEVPASI